MLKDPASIALAAFFSFLGVGISVYQILCHLRNYTEPVFQRYIIRIIFMVPVYAIGSFCSLQWRDGAIYFDTLRDCYEAWIIYNFSALLLAYVGGPGAVVVKAEGKIVHPSWPHLTCCLPAMQVDGFFLRRCKQGTVQFVLLKPVMAALVLIMYAAGTYTDGDMSPHNGYFYISIMYNICYTLALYGLILFWNGASELLQPFNPLLKFVLVKTVVFLTFWQGIGISAINSMGKISDPEDGKALQNFMICCEMAIAGIALLYAFPHKEYQIGGSTSGWKLGAFTHAISINDVIKDAIHVFAPSYSDYVLYSDGGPADNVKRKKFRGQKGGAGSDHPKAGKAMTTVPDEPGGPDSDGRRSKTPPAAKHLEANRNQAILLDSDSDGMDSEDEGSELCGTDSDDSLSRLGSAQQADSFAAGPGRSSPSITQSSRTTPRQTVEITAAAQKQLQKRASSKRMKKAGGAGTLQQQHQGAEDGMLIKASYPATPEGAAAAAAPPAGAAAAAKGGLAAMRGVLKGGPSRRGLPIALLYRGPILSDSDSEDEGLPAAAADRSSLLAPGHQDSAAPAAAAPPPPAAPAPAAAAVMPPAPKLTVLGAPPSRGKAAAVRQAVAGAAQAAGRAMAAAQAGSGAAGGSRQPGVQVVVPADTMGRSSSPIVLTPPKRSAMASAGEAGSSWGAAAGSPRRAATVTEPQPPQQAAAAGVKATAAGSQAAAAQWEPAFPQAGAEGQEKPAGSWAQGGWSSVAL